MSISYEKLFKLMELKGINKNYLRNNGIHSTSVDKLLKNENVDTRTIGKLCKLLQCQPGDILEYIDDQE